MWSPYQNVRILNLKRVWTIWELVAAASWKVVICPVYNLYSISSVLGIDIKINGEMMHTIEMPILQHCQWRHESWSNDVSLNNFIKKIEVRIPESMYHISNNSFSLVFWPGFACKCWVWKCLFNYGWKVRMRINIRTFHVKTNQANMVSAFCIHKIHRHYLWKYIQYILEILVYIWLLR